MGLISILKDDMVEAARAGETMYITKEELEKRLNKTEIKIQERERKTRKNSINGEGEKRLDHTDRTLIGILSELDTQQNIADLVGVSQNTVSLASRGITTVAAGVDKELRDDVKEGISKIATERKDREKVIEDQLITNLAAALGHVANNLDNTDATEASKIAVDMSKILDRVTGEKDNGRGNRTAIIINVPAMKEEKSFQVIDV
jgi:transcriptional regulator with XRE-family HTH domain